MQRVGFNVFFFVAFKLCYILTSTLRTATYFSINTPLFNWIELNLVSFSFGSINLRVTVWGWQKGHKWFLISYYLCLLATCRRYKTFMFSPELPWCWQPIHAYSWFVCVFTAAVSWLLLSYSTWLHLLCRPWSKSAIISITRPRANNSASDSRPFRVHTCAHKMSCLFHILHDFLMICLCGEVCESGIWNMSKRCEYYNFTTYLCTWTDFNTMIEDWEAHDGMRVYRFENKGL